MSRTPAEVRAAIVAEAYTWLGTPYVSCAAVKGAGVDCAMLLIRIAQHVGVVSPDYDPRPYPPEWFLHQDEERYIAGLEKWAHRVDDPEPGDIALYRYGRTAAHGAVLVSPELLIHAYLPHGSVGLIERSSGVFLDPKGRSRLDSYWSVV